jgi:uncharacterized protein YukE
LRIYCDTLFQQLIKVVRRSGETTSKRAGAEELLDSVEPRWFRYTFVPTYMTFVGQSTDPWEVPTKQAVEVMQKIWDTTSECKYEIAASTAIYQKVCRRNSSVLFQSNTNIYFSDCSTLCRLVVKCYWEHWHHVASGLFRLPRRIMRFR